MMLKLIINKVVIELSMGGKNKQDWKSSLRPRDNQVLIVQILQWNFFFCELQLLKYTGSFIVAKKSLNSNIKIRTTGHIRTTGRIRTTGQKSGSKIKKLFTVFFIFYRLLGSNMGLSGTWGNLRVLKGWDNTLLTLQ